MELIRTPRSGQLCGWTGCHYDGDAVLEGRLLCRDHFHQTAAKKLEQYHSRLQSANEDDSERAALSKFVSEIISQTTMLVSRTKLLTQEKRALFLELSHASLQFYKRVQRNPRQNKRITVVLTNGQGEPARREETVTINVSLKGACFESAQHWLPGKAITIQRLDTDEMASARIVRVDQDPGATYRIGVEILDSDDFWHLNQKQPEGPSKVRSGVCDKVAGSITR